MQFMLMKYDYLSKQMSREQEFYSVVPRTMPLKIDEHIYYRRFDNAADSLSLYRFPIEKLPEWQPDQTELIGQDVPPKQANDYSGEIPSYPRDPELDERLDHQQIQAAKEFNKTFPEE